MVLEIKAAGSTDESEVIALWRTCGLVVSHNDPVTDYRRALGKPNSDILVGAVSDEMIIASTMVGHDGHRGWLYYVAVHPEYRLKGFGRSIVDAGEKWLNARGVAKAKLMIRETNTQVAAFYEQIGFKTIPRTLMEKWLRTSNQDTTRAAGNRHVAG
jgi:ribosomal protein S18 acetylase RimI-like enzyme